MAFRPLRRAPMMLGGVGFQSGLDEARRKRRAAAIAANDTPGQRDVAQQLLDLKGLLDDGALTAEEFQAAKRKVLGT
jgi:hypothetical protein